MFPMLCSFSKWKPLAGLLVSILTCCIKAWKYPDPNSAGQPVTVGKIELIMKSIMTDIKQIGKEIRI